MNKKNPGFVLILAVLITAVMTIAVTTLINRALVFGRITSTLQKREQARLLALSGIQIALAQLAATSEQKNSDTKKTSPPGQSPPPEPIKSVPGLLKIINRWQQFNFTQESDNLDGSCQLYIASEQGKININALYDFKKKQFIKQGSFDGLKLCQFIGGRLSSFMTSNKFVEALKSALKEHTEPLQDITQLLTQTQFAAFKNNIFLEPNSNMALLDLFTAGTHTLVQPWFLSRSLCSVIEIPCIGELDIKKIENFLKTLQPKDMTPWSERWNTTVAPVYGKQWSALSPDVQILFNQKLETDAFSIISYGTFGGIVEKIYAIVYKQQGSRDKPGAYCIKKLYWI